MVKKVPSNNGMSFPQLVLHVCDLTRLVRQLYFHCCKFYEKYQLYDILQNNYVLYDQEQYYYTAREVPPSTPWETFQKSICLLLCHQNVICSYQASMLCINTDRYLYKKKFFKSVAFYVKTLPFCNVWQYYTDTRMSAPPSTVPELLKNFLSSSHISNTIFTKVQHTS